MKAPISKADLQRLRVYLSKGSVLIFDFDGTLAPIVRRPENAEMPISTERLLRDLSEAFFIAIVTGRSLRDIQRRVPSVVTYVIGNHGWEGMFTSAAERRRAKAKCLRWKKQLRLALRSTPELKGAWVEDKEFSLSIHYRECKNPEKAARAIRVHLIRLNPKAAVIGGKNLFNLLPSLRITKALAVRNILKAAGAKTGIYCGDDDTDEHVFESCGRSVLGIRIGPVLGSLRTKADLILKDQTKMNALLRAMRKIAREVQS